VNPKPYESVKTELWDVKRLDEDPELVTSLRWLVGSCV
jgi:hypothetical protein